MFETTVHSVKSPKAAEIDDELAKRFGADDLEALKSQIRERLAAEYQGASRALVKRQLLDRLDELVGFDLPQSLVDAEAAGVDLAEMHRRYGADIPMGRIGRPDEIARAVALLARADVGALVGQTLQVNGGSTRCRV